MKEKIETKGESLLSWEDHQESPNSNDADEAAPVSRKYPGNSSKSEEILLKTIISGKIIAMDTSLHTYHYKNNSYMTLRIFHKSIKDYHYLPKK